MFLQKCNNVKILIFKQKKFNIFFFRFVHQCCETICLASGEFYRELIKYDDLMQNLINFLNDQTGNLNHLIVSFYSKIIISLLSVDNGTVKIFLYIVFYFT